MTSRVQQSISLTSNLPLIKLESKYWRHQDEAKVWNYKSNVSSQLFES